MNTYEKERDVDQKSVARFEHVCAHLAAHKRLFAAQGAVVATWRMWNGRRLGPYFKLAYRECGRQCSLYLGRCHWLARRVRLLLAEYRQRRRERRGSARLQRQIRASLRKVKDQLKTLLFVHGVRMKGLEFRGAARTFPIVKLTPDDPPTDGPPPAAPTGHVVSMSKHELTGRLAAATCC